MDKSLIFWLVLIVVAVGLMISADIFRDKTPGSISQETPIPSETALPSVSPSPSSKPTSGPTQIAATCQVSGQIVFLDKNLYENKNAKIVYQNVDDAIRQIYWKSEPDDGALAIGPNLFEDLPLPNGERNVGLAINKETFAKSYTLTASINYGIKNANGMVEERIANCAGKVVVQMP